MKKCTCGNPVIREHDRLRCICGRSYWKGFSVRPPTEFEMRANGGASNGKAHSGAEVTAGRH